VRGGAGISGALYIENTGDVSANLGAFQTYANLTLSTVANAASQEAEIDSLSANIGAYQTYANANVVAIQANIGAFYTYANTKIGTNTNSNLVVVATTTSTSTTTGALVVGGGAGIAGNLNLGVGSTSTVPLAFAATQTTGGNVNVPIQGAIEANIGVGATGTAANVFYATPTAATSSGRALVQTAHTFVLGGNTSMNGGVAFTGGAAYPVFGGPVTAGAWVGNVMLAAGTTYEFELKAMASFAAASTSSTLALRFVGNATVIYSNYETTVVGVSGTTVTAPSLTNHFGTTILPTTTAAGAATYTNFMIRARGIIDVDAQGTLNPCFVFATGPAQVATAVQGSYMKWTPLGTAANIAIGTVMGGAWAGGVGY
jgi:hypothetical protein